MCHVGQSATRFQRSTRPLPTSFFESQDHRVFQKVGYHRLEVTEVKWMVDSTRGWSRFIKISICRLHASSSLVFSDEPRQTPQDLWGISVGYRAMSQQTGCESAEDSRDQQFHCIAGSVADSQGLTVKLKRLTYGMSTARSLESLAFTELCDALWGIYEEVPVYNWYPEFGMSVTCWNILPRCLQSRYVLWWG